ncbi:MAG: threonine/serine exporter family protein [Eubacteriales bacterium]|nr:threonine/serine exporter family protein [Eubacteriales bacterium]
MLLRKQAKVEQVNIEEFEQLKPQEYLPQAVMQIAMQAGTILLSSGAETYRVENTVGIILSLAKSSDYDVTAMGTSITAFMVSQDGEHTNTQIRRVRHRSLNLQHIATVNQISRDLVAGKIQLTEAAECMNELKKPVYSKWEKNLAIVVMVCSFALLLSGRFEDFFAAAPVAFGIIFVNALVQYIRVEGFFAHLLSAFVGACMAFASQHYLFPMASLDIIIAGALMPLLPGTSFTNAIRDVIQGDYISAAARAMEAVFVALALSIGVGFALGLFAAFL